MSISVVVGSWKAYNECNKRALGSSWLDLSDFYDIDDLIEELKNQGFTDEELEETFIQDIEGLDISGHCDNTSIYELFEIFDNGGLEDEDKLEVANAVIEAQGVDDLFNKINSNYCHWDDDIHFYKDVDWEDYGRECFFEYGYKTDLRESSLRFLEDYIDFEDLGKNYFGDCAYEISNGIIVIND